MDDESHLNSLVRMFEQALMLTITLPETPRDDLLARLDSVRDISHSLGYGVGNYMDNLLAEHGVDV